MTNSISTMRQVILVDYPSFCFIANFAEISKSADGERTALNKLLVSLRLLALQKDDIIIVACSDQKTWREDIWSGYWHDKRKLPYKYIDPSYLHMIQDSTPFHVIFIDKLESYDIIATAVKYYVNEKIIILSTDDRFLQLTEYNEIPNGSYNVQVASPKSNYVKQPKNRRLELLKRINTKLENMNLLPVSRSVMFYKLHTIYDLITMPLEVAQKVEMWLNAIDNNKPFEINKCWYTKLRNKITEIYGNKNQIKKKMTTNHRLVFK